MARQANVVEVNSFVGGLVTEASPLTFPANASLDESNFVLNQDGSRQRRLGIDLEENYSVITTGTEVTSAGVLFHSFYKWENVGGDPTKVFLVVQTGREIRFFDPADIGTTALSSSLVYTFTEPYSDYLTCFSYASVDGTLYVATGAKQVVSYSYTPTGGLVRASHTLLIRDIFGLEDKVGGIDYRSGNNTATRLTSLSDNHLYNLRNQTWALPRKYWTNEDIKDPIQEFYDVDTAKYPSNVDSVPYALMADANDGDDRETERFNAKFLINNPIGTTPAPIGYFIIDALERGESREEAVLQLQSENPDLSLLIHSTDIPREKTPGGASVISEFAGRVFYSGFRGEVEVPDQHSPKMSSYVLFSQLINSTADAANCYQQGDPTSKEEPDLVDTDGGLIRIEGAYGIIGLIPLENYLFVIASNGVWSIAGGSDYGFSATNYSVRKVTENGCTAKGSVVVVDNSFMYWGKDGIYHITKSQLGDWVSTNISNKAIKSFYNSISQKDIMDSVGAYDSYEKVVSWVYSNSVLGVGSTYELNLDLALGAFYKTEIKVDATTSLPRVLRAVEVPAFRVEEALDEVTSEGLVVTSQGVPVTTPVRVPRDGLKEKYYLTVTDLSPVVVGGANVVKYSFSYYRDETFKDWVSLGYSLDADAFLVTGYLTAGDMQRTKTVPYISFHLLKTEDGFVEDINGDLTPKNQSSCKVQAQWDWTNSAAGNRWGQEFQAYRLPRVYLPTGLSDNFDNGVEVVTTKNKLRGKGRALSLLIKTEADKDCRLLGWSMVVGANSNV